MCDRVMSGKVIRCLEPMIGRDFRFYCHLDTLHVHIRPWCSEMQSLAEKGGDGEEKNGEGSHIVSTSISNVPEIKVPIDF